MERLLDIGREKWCPDLFLGEGDGGVPDVMEATEDRAARDAKLCGRFHGIAAENLEAAVALETKRLLTNLREDLSVPQRLRQEATAPFAKLQATLIEAAWEPAQFEVALEMMRSWLADGLDGRPCPFLVKQFASYFAMWTKDIMVDQHSHPVAEPLPANSMEEAPQHPHVDDIVDTLVRDLINTASSSWVEQCIQGSAIELIAEHISALQVDNRMEAFAAFLTELGKHSDGVDEAGEGSLRATVLERCMLTFWNQFPREVFQLLAVLVRKSLGIAHGTVAEEVRPAVGPIGVSSEASSANIVLSLRCLVAFWVVMRDKQGDDFGLEEAFAGLERLTGTLPPEVNDCTTSADLARVALKVVILPLLLDSLLCLSVKDVDSALMVLPMLQKSQLWQDAFSSCGDMADGIAELDWYLGLHQRCSDWSSAFSKRRVEAEVQSDESTARDALLDWARMRLARDQSLLQPVAGSQTTLAAGHWENMRRAIACQVLEVLLSTYEQACDFDGATHDLAVVVAQSPWMLSLVRPEIVRSFLQRVALIATRLDGLGAYYAEPENPAIPCTGAVGSNPGVLAA